MRKPDYYRRPNDPEGQLADTSRLSDRDALEAIAERCREAMRPPHRPWQADYLVEQVEAIWGLAERALLPDDTWLIDDDEPDEEDEDDEDD